MASTLYCSSSSSSSSMKMNNVGLAMLLSALVCIHLACVSGKPATFQQDFKVTWAESHLKLVEGGNAIQLILDRNSGCGFASKYKYMYGRVSMKIKLVPGDSAGTVTAFYMNSDTGLARDELDFEFLGNRSGQPYTVQTNIYANGKGGREQRVNLWFDPSLDYHTYSIRWSHYNVVFYVDEVPIRIYKNNSSKGVAFPSSQPMGVFSTLWDADNWATRGGMEKIDWRKAPFNAYYKEFDIEGCPAPIGPGPIPLATKACASNLNNWWEGLAYRELSQMEARSYRWVRMNHMVYDYCTDKSRFHVPPPECGDGI